MGKDKDKDAKKAAKKAAKEAAAAAADAAAATAPAADKKNDKKTKEKKSKDAAADAEDKADRPPRPRAILPIAKPLADDKLARKVLKLAKSATARKQVKRGVKEVVKALRKGATGVCVLAGDVSPVDVIAHLPVFCEDKGVGYVWVSSKEALGAAGLTKRPTSCMLVLATRPAGAAAAAAKKRAAKAKEGKDSKPPVEEEDDKTFDAAYKEVAAKVAALTA
jgi:H/ACA ribonucleoprotein complex subunit 2